METAETHTEAVGRAAFVIVALLVLVLEPAFDDALGWLADALVTMARKESHKDVEQ